MRKLVYGLLAALLVSAISADAAEFTLSRYFSDNMVLQREKPVNVWGTAKKGEKVTVNFAGQSKTAVASKDGQWVVTLDSLKTSDKGSELTVSAGKGKAVLSNVVVGDVWFFGRQTYVDISLGRNDAGKTAASKYKPSGDFRAIVIKTIPAKTPQSDLTKDATSGWMKVDRKNALGMSAAAFYLGDDLTKELGVPVGIVDVNMSHYFGIGWMSGRAIDDSITMFPKDKEISWLSGWMREQCEERDSGKAQADLDKYYAERMKGKGEKPLLGLHPLRNPMYPSAGYNAIINPLKSMTVKGILLQLGNDYPFIAYREIEKQGLLATKPGYDSGWHHNYVILKNGYRVTPVTLPYVTGDWRRALGDKALPIGMILPPASDLDVYAAHNREIRELHRRTAEKGGMGIIMPGNKNIPSSGQPEDDKLLAARCAKWVLGAESGPVFERVESSLGKATIYFKEGTADGLKATGDALDYFETAGPDRVFTPAKATVEGSTIKLKNSGALEFVRFNWTYRPDQGLANSAGLPALPFNTDPGWVFGWIPPPETPSLPEEYSLTANKWSKSDIAIINGQIASMAIGDSEPIPRRPGPLGIVSAPFGPNIYVVSTDPGTPAVGKILPGDVIYGVNGEVFESGPEVASDEQYRALSSAITYSESEEGEGKMILGVRRGTKTMEVELELEVLGSYSSTTPYYCEKSQNIVKNAEEWSSSRYRPESGMPSMPVGMLNTDLLFLMASGNPEHQGLVRRAVYNMMARMDPKPVTRGMRSKPWTTGYTSLVLGEYYHVTGDRNVLPYLKYQVDLSAESQLKPGEETPPDWEAAQSTAQVGGWRQNSHTAPDRWKSGYGLMPHAGMPCVMGMLLANEAGLDIDRVALERGLTQFNKNRAEYGSVVYSYDGSHRQGPPTISPEGEAKGKLWSMNGKLGTAAALYNMVDYKTSVDICSRHCIYGFNNTRGGHGGMFFNNFWTPVGAWAGGEAGFKHFMKGQTWWRELFRRHDGAFNQVGRGHVGVSYALPYVAPKKRLRMLNAPKSAFGTSCPAYLKEALDAHKKRDYALCESLILKQLNDSITPAQDVPTVNHMLDAVRTLRASIEHDLSLTEKLIKDGKHYYASLEVPQLKGVVAEGDARLSAIIKALGSAEGVAKVQEHQKVCAAAKSAMDAAKKAAAQPVKKEKWVSKIAKTGGKWQMKIVEHIDHAPEGWIEPNFDDAAWSTGSMPLAWTMYHTGLFRGKFNVDDKSAVDSVRVQGNFFQQANVVVYLNGKIVAKVDNLGRGGGIADVRFTDYAMKLLKRGENTVAVSTRHQRRWGPYRGTYKAAVPMSFWVETRQVAK